MAESARESARRPFDARDFAERVASVGAEGLERRLGDHVLNPDLSQLAERPDARAAAVLVPVVDREEGATIILTTRAKGLRNHSGQVAFPGGSIDPGDASPEAAALREAHEEIALDPAFVETIGRLPVYVSGTGFVITPVLALVRPGFTLAPEPGEVADVFEVPLSFLMDAANHTRESRMWQGRERHYYVMPFGERFIWGVTAGIIRTLYERLYA
jgi:8-oxo-dGTP pyrophosphatase MutT (NUDIX family)